MKNSNEPAFPTFGSASDENPKIITPQDYGLSKREYFAAMAMQGFLAGRFPSGDYENESVAKVAIGFADELLKQLEK